MEHFADRLLSAVRAKKNSLCVGLDPRWENLPRTLRERHLGSTLENVAAAYQDFCCRIIDVVTPLVPVVKPQSAFFEACGPAGLESLQHVLQAARAAGLITILDGKRNDIASTAQAYADAAFGGVRVVSHWRPVWDADALTVNAYLGRDAVEPFLQSARRSGRGVFILVRTSNAGAGQFQDLVSDGKPLYMHVAEAVRHWSSENVGRSGYGDVGAVVGATHAAELAAVRRLAPEVLLLVPGYGAQGGAAADVAPAFHDNGLGAIVNSSRGVIFAFTPEETDWEASVEAAARAAITRLSQETPMGRLGLHPQR